MSKLELESGAAIIQIATLTKVFIFDGYKCNNELIRQCLIDYFQGQGLTIGHAFNNDLGTMLHSFGFTPS